MNTLLFLSFVTTHDDLQKILKHVCKNKNQGGNSQNFLRKFVNFSLTLSLKILRLFRLKVLFEADLIKG